MSFWNKLKTFFAIRKAMGFRPGDFKSSVPNVVHAVKYFEDSDNANIIVHMKVKRNQDIDGTGG